MCVSGCLWRASVQSNQHTDTIRGRAANCVPHTLSVSLAIWRKLNFMSSLFFSPFLWTHTYAKVEINRRGTWKKKLGMRKIALMRIALIWMESLCVCLNCVVVVVDKENPRTIFFHHIRLIFLFVLLAFLCKLLCFLFSISIIYSNSFGWVCTRRCCLHSFYWVDFWCFWEIHKMMEIQTFWSENASAGPEHIRNILRKCTTDSERPQRSNKPQKRCFFKID